MRAPQMGGNDISNIEVIHDHNTNQRNTKTANSPLSNAKFNENFRDSDAFSPEKSARKHI